MKPAPLIIAPQAADAPGTGLRGSHLVIQDWPATGVAQEVAPLHVHYGNDEAWHVVSGALRFWLGDDEFTVGAGSTVLIPAGMPHTFGNAGPEPSRYIIILTARLDELIRELHAASPAERTEIYRRHESELLE